MPLHHADMDAGADPTWALFRRASFGDKLASAVILCLLSGLAAFVIALVIGVPR